MHPRRQGVNPVSAVSRPQCEVYSCDFRQSTVLKLLFTDLLQAATGVLRDARDLMTLLEWGIGADDAVVGADAGPA